MSSIPNLMNLNKVSLYVVSAVAHSEVERVWTKTNADKSTKMILKKGKVMLTFPGEQNCERRKEHTIKK